MFCSYFTIKYFPLVFVSLVSNIAPLLVALFSYILYKYALHNLYIINLILSFIGVAILITGAPEKSKNGENTSESTEKISLAIQIVATVLLICIPINQCCMQLLLRNMRNLSEYSITSWLIIGMLVIFLPASYLTQDHET